MYTDASQLLKQLYKEKPKEHTVPMNVSKIMFLAVELFFHILLGKPCRDERQ